MTTVDQNEVLNTSIDIENGFKKMLFSLRRRVVRSSSRQMLNHIIKQLFKNNSQGIGKTDLAIAGFVEESFEHNIPSNISPRELIEKILSYENQHLRFYAGLRETDMYVKSKETCDILLNYKLEQIKITAEILEEMQLPV